LVILARGSVAAQGPKEEIFQRPPTLEVARITGCKNFSRARPVSGGAIEAQDWDVTLRVEHTLEALPKHVAVRAHHVRVLAPEKDAAARRENVFPCWLAGMSETPFRVALDLRIGSPPSNPSDFHVQAEVSKREWESFCNLPQPWLVELAPARLFLL